MEEETFDELGLKEKGIEGIAAAVEAAVKANKEEEKVSVSTALSPIMPTTYTADDLKGLIGEDGYDTIVQIAKSQGKSLEEFVNVTTIASKLSGIEVFSGKDRGPHNMVLVDDDKNEIDMDVVGLQDAGQGYQGYSVDSLYDSMVNGLEWTAGNIGSSLSTVFAPILKLGDLDAIEKRHETMLKKVRDSMTSLGEVFGFDNYEHIEMFFAAWLMKDSTCRLSGIPGTGKTTVIECAAVLLCNSYGYTTKPRYVAATGRQYTMDQLFGENNAYPPQEYESGQDYNLKYSNSAYENVYNDWEGWRFTSWSEPTGSNRSGAYNYDFEFLHETSKGKSGKIITKTPMKSEDLYLLLNNCWEARVPPEGFDTSGLKEGYTTKDILASLDTDKLRKIVAPIQIMDKDGNFKAIGSKTYSVMNEKGKGEDFPMSLRFPNINDEDETNYEKILAVGDASEFIQKSGKESYGLFTDAGRAEGYGFRNYILTYFQDLRAKDKQFKPILEEMLQENGVAKIDYEKRADEVLYGIEIQQATKVDPARNSTVSTYEFEPVPRPIVTQPIKFFNEANRSQAGVEDAVLGLIAERKVEYRGKTFNSPSFVAWMDTNPHQKGNDLAFIDRIDMELLFKTVSLGARYTQLSGRFAKKTNKAGNSGQSGLSPQDQLVVKIIEGGDVGFEAMRFNELEKVWNFVLKEVGYAPPGQAPGSSTYDALREISYISVLFTQRFQPRNSSLKAGGTPLTTKASGNYFESPLMDFSTTTNTNEDGMSQLNPSNEMKQTYEGHTPFNINRVLGFRFTNSLVKLSSALAFLRGKSYVGRKEILDGLPYVTAHRLGRAKSSKGEISGMDGVALQYNNEQEWIREAIVNGYLLQDISIGFSNGEVPIMDTWELYYRRCVDVLKSAPALFWYEQQVLKPLNEMMKRGGAVGQTMTPVHWHIATMVIENERTATQDSSIKPLRTYKHGDEDSNNYQSNKNYYLSRVTGTPNTNKPKSDQTLHDYYQLRGDICSEPELFSDDRDDLLDLLASKMSEICGGPALNKSVGNSSKIAIVQTKSMAMKGIGDKASPFDHDTTKFAWRTYQDSIGGWGRLLNSPGSSGVASVANQFTRSQKSGQVSESASFSDQALIITGRMEVRPPVKSSLKGISSAGSLQRQAMVAQVQKLSSKFQPDTSEGVRLVSLVSGDTENITFDQFMRKCQDAISEYPTREVFSDTQFTVGDGADAISFDMAEGLVACFPLQHSAGAPSGGGDFSGEDTLRLWVRLFQSDMSSATSMTAGKDSVPFVTLNLTMGITSNLATKSRYLNIIPSDAKGEDQLAYTAAEYLKTFGATKGGKIQDSGNLSKTDVLNYQVMFNDAL